MRTNNDYENSKPETGTSWWQTHKLVLWDGLVNNWCSWLGPLLFGVGVMALLLFCAVKCSNMENKQRAAWEKQVTVEDSTFVAKTDGYYIYRRTLDGHQYLMYTDYKKDKTGNQHHYFIHDPDCPCLKH